MRTYLDKGIRGAGITRGKKIVRSWIDQWMDELGLFRIRMRHTGDKNKTYPLG